MSRIVFGGDSVGLNALESVDLWWEMPMVARFSSVFPQHLDFFITGVELNTGVLQKTLTSLDLDDSYRLCACFNHLSSVLIRGILTCCELGEEQIGCGGGRGRVFNRRWVDLRFEISSGFGGLDEWGCEVFDGLGGIF